jgi:hypothetical protein
MTLRFENLSLNYFRNEKDFLDRWKDHVQTLVSLHNSRHNLRVQMIEKFKILSVEVDDRSIIEIDAKCLFSKEIITKAEYFVWFSNCKEYHKLSAKAIYEHFLSKKVNKFQCPLCDGWVNSIKDIRLDIISFQYFSIIEVVISI